MFSVIHYNEFPLYMQCFPQKGIAADCQGGGWGPANSLSSVLLYTDAPCEGEDVGVYRVLLFYSITLLAKEFSTSQ